MYDCQIRSTTRGRLNGAMHTYPMVSDFGFPDTGRHPKSLVPFKEEPFMIRIIVFCCPYWGPPSYGKYASMYVASVYGLRLSLLRNLCF